MKKNITKNEQIIRVVIGIVLGTMAFFMSSLSGWVRGVLGIVALSFLATAFLGYWLWKGVLLKVFSKEKVKEEIASKQDQ